MVATLELTGASLTHAGMARRAIDSIELTVDAGELVAVIGPNGSGKSTLLRAAAGLVPLDAGLVRTRGVPLAELEPRARAREVAVVPQGLEAIPPFTVFDFVAGGRYARSEAATSRGHREAIETALVHTAMTAFAQRSLESLSGGERQRALVARALAQDTPILLGDEPTASLDPGHQVLVLELFARAARDGRAVLLVTHDLNLASQFANRVVLLDQGRIAALGTPTQILCSNVLTPVFGPHLHFASTDGPAPTPIVIARRPEESP